MRKANPQGWQTIRVIAIARAISILGDELAIFALLLRVKHNGGGALSIAAVMAAGQLPLILLSPWAGTVVDRVPVRRLAPILCFAQAAFAAALAIKASLLVSLALICLIGVGQAFTGPAWTATLPEIVNKEELPRAMSFMQALYALAGIAGPGIAGIMVSRFGFVTPMLADAATFLLLAIVPIFLTLPFHAREQGSRTRGDVWVGLQIVRKEPVIRALTILGFSLNVTAGISSVAELFFALDNLHASTFIYGLTGSLFAAGLLGASLVNQRREVSSSRLPANIIVGGVIAGLGIVFTGLAWHWAILLPTAVFTGVGVATLNAYFFALMLQRAPDASRGRVTSAVQGITTAGQIASFAIGGVVVSIIDPRIVILLSGAACLLATFFLAPSLRSASRTPQIYQMEPEPIATDFPVVEPE